MANEQFFIDSDNLVELNKLTDQSDGSFVNSAVVTMSLYKTFPVANDQQTVTLLDAASGTFVLELDEYITENLAFDTSAQQMIDAMIAANPNISAGDLVAGSVNRDLDSAQAGNAISFVFQSALASKAQNPMTINIDNILPTSAVGSIVQDTVGKGDVLDNANGITLDYTPASDGNYSGVIPDNVELTEFDNYYLVVIATSGSSTLKSVKRWPAVYHGKQREV